MKLLCYSTKNRHQPLRMLLVGALMCAPLAVGTPTVMAAEHGSGHHKMGGMMGGEAHGSGHGGSHGMGHKGGGKSMQPHNAAVHFLQMSQMLDLDSHQQMKIRQIRDTYNDRNAADEARLSAATADLKSLIHADPMDMEIIDQVLTRKASLEGRLWRAFVSQLHDIKAILTDDQKARLRAKHMRKHGQ